MPRRKFNPRGCGAAVRGALRVVAAVSPESAPAFRIALADSNARIIKKLISKTPTERIDQKSRSNN